MFSRSFVATMSRFLFSCSFHLRQPTESARERERTFYRLFANLLIAPHTHTQTHPEFEQRKILPKILHLIISCNQSSHKKEAANTFARKHTQKPPERLSVCPFVRKLVNFCSLCCLYICLCERLLSLCRAQSAAAAAAAVGNELIL